MDDLDSFVARRLAHLIDDLESDADEVRWDAASDIKDMGTAAAAAVPFLVKVLLDRRPTEFDPYIRGMACDALRAIGPEAREAIPALIECTADEPGLPEESRWLRLRAAEAIFRISGEDDISRRVAVELANDPEEWLRKKAEECLKKESS